MRKLRNHQDGLEEEKRGREEKEEECEVTPLLLFVEQFSHRATDCAGSAVPPLCPPIQVTKAHFGDFAGKAEKASVPHFPYFIYSPLESKRLRDGSAHL